MFNARGKPLPHLTDYLATANAKHHAVTAREAARGVTLVLCLAALGFAVPVFFIAAFHSVPLGLAGAAVSLGCAVPVLLQTMKFFRERRRAKTDQERIHQAAMEIVRAMVASRRLHKELDAAAVQLLEESARYWQEIAGGLASPGWTDPNLAAHWQAIRNQTLAATDQAMDEEIVLLKDSFVPGNRHRGWETVIEDVIETFVTGPRPFKSGYLPKGFEQARQVAEKLKLTAAGIREADLTLSGSPTVGRRVGTALDVALSDMRSIQEAENELRQNLRG